MRFNSNAKMLDNKGKMPESGFNSKRKETKNKNKKK